MRESVPHPPRLQNIFRACNLFRFATNHAVLPVAALCFGLAGCSEETKGQVILALQTDMSMPDDVTKVKIEVKADGVSRFDQVFVVDPNAPDPDKIPATLAVVAGEKENETIELKVVALRERSDGSDEPRTLNKTITTIPKERIAMLRVPMQWLCTDKDGDFIDDFGDGEFESSCPKKDGKERACVAGGCEDVRIDSSKLPDFAADAVFGGGNEQGSGGTCFPTEACFDAGVTMMPDADCVISFEPDSDDIINFAVLAADGGICRGGFCYVGLDKSREFGWYELEDGEGSSGAGGAPGGGDGEGGGGTDGPLEAPAGRRFQLPQGVCKRIADGRAFGVRVSTDDACEITKTPQFPTCGPWSSVGTDVVPPEPPPTDADGDGFDTTDVGGDDCDDDDDTVHPEALELCDDALDSNCNGDPDDCISTGDADGDGAVGEADCDDNDNSSYPGALEACDEVDNDCDGYVDDDCVADLPFSHRVDFSILDGFMSSADYAIYQAFDAISTFDLDEKTITFVPNAAHTRYTVSAGEVQWDDDVGELVHQTTDQDVSNCDDCYTNVPLEFPFTFYGVEYTSVFPSSNGYLTFGIGDSSYSESIQAFLANAPRISAFWSDLDTTGAPAAVDTTPPPETIDDEVYAFSDANKLVVTYQNIQLFPSSGTSNTFQFVLLADGTITISYDGIADLDRGSLVGITPGSLGNVECSTDETACFGICADLQTDAEHCGACGNFCVSGLCSAGACAGEVRCDVSATRCDGLCFGFCPLDTAAVCEGRCNGTCDGTCDLEDTPGHCDGTCDGDCLGTCYLEAAGGHCPALCSGSCYADTAVECGDPTIDNSGACVFNAATLTSADFCYDAATVANNANFNVNCSTDACRCCKSSGGSQVCFPLETTAATACASAAALRATLIDECMEFDQCGAGCPPTVPPARAACNASDITTCAYFDSSTSISTSCTCMGDMFICQ